MAYPRATRLDSIVPGLASNPVWRIAVFALLVPAPTSGPASTRTQRAPWRVSSRATAQPTAPAPTTATSKGPSGAGPSRNWGNGFAIDGRHEHRGGIRLLTAKFSRWHAP